MKYNIHAIVNKIPGADGFFVVGIEKARKDRDKERFIELLNQYKLSDDVLREILDWYYLEHLED